MTAPEDPPRWSDGTDTPSALSGLLSGAKLDSASDAELSELRARLSAALNEPPPRSSSPAVHPFAKLAAGAFIAALGIGAVLYLQRRNAPTKSAHDLPRAPLSKHAGSPAPVTAAAPPPVLAAPSTEPALGPPPSGSPKKHSTGLPAAAEGGPSGAQSEAVLLEQARAALATSPSQALALTRQHAVRFPHGSLSQEREVIAISALRRLGHATEADARAARFDALYPKSAHQHAVDRPTTQ